MDTKHNTFIGKQGVIRGGQAASAPPSSPLSPKWDGDIYIKFSIDHFHPPIFNFAPSCPPKQ